MKNVHINKLAMYLVVLAVLERFKDIVAKIEAFAEKASVFRGLVDDITLLSEDVGMGTLGKTNVKKSDAAVMADTVSKLVGLLHAYAFDKKDHDLMVDSDITPTTISEKRDAQRAAFAKSRVDLVENHKADLVKWGVTDEAIAKAYQTIETYKDSLGKRDEARSMHSGQRKSIAALFNDADGVLEGQIDRFVESLEPGYPEFYADYKAARVIKDVAASRGKGNGNNPPASSGNTAPAS